MEGYICKNIEEGETFVVVAKNIAEAFDKVEDITPCDVQIQGVSVKIYS